MVGSGLAGMLVLCVGEGTAVEEWCGAGWSRESKYFHCPQSLHSLFSGLHSGREDSSSFKRYSIMCSIWWCRKLASHPLSFTVSHSHIYQWMTMVSIIAFSGVVQMSTHTCFSCMTLRLCDIISTATIHILKKKNLVKHRKHNSLIEKRKPTEHLPAKIGSAVCPKCQTGNGNPGAWGKCNFLAANWSPGIPKDTIGTRNVCPTRLATAPPRECPVNQIVDCGCLSLISL